MLEVTVALVVSQLVLCADVMCSVGKMLGMKFWQEFIELYKSEPCLWQIRHEKYKKSQYKNRAYERLLEKFKEFDPDATIDCLKKKINGLRTCYRREFMKQKRSIESGAVGDEIYEPKLWYYEALSFLRDQDMEAGELHFMLEHSMDEEKTTEPPRKMLKISDTEAESVCQIKRSDSHKEQCAEVEPATQSKAKHVKPQKSKLITDAVRDQSPLQQNTQPEHSKARMRAREEDDLFTLRSQNSAYDRVPPETLNTRVRMRDDADIFAEAWAVTFRKLSPEQQIYAKRGIEELLMHGQLGNLCIDSIQIRQPAQQPTQYYAEQVTTTNSAQTRPDNDVVHLTVMKEEGDETNYD